jgi:ribose transport system permease protein
MLKKDLGLLVLIIIVGAVVAIINPRFLSPINIANTANLVGLFGIFSIGQGFVIITGGIELSVGSIIALLGVIFVDLIANQGVLWPFAALAVLVIGAVMGLVHGLLITKLKLQPFVVTLCGLLIYRGIARFYTKDATAGFPFGVNFPELEWITTGRTDIVALLTGDRVHSVPIPHAFFIMLVIVVIMWVVLHRSVFGRYLYAVGKNEEAARYSGIRTIRVIVAAYIICTTLAALSAIFLPCTPARSCLRATAISTSSTRSPRRCSAASLCEGVKAQSSASSSAPCCSRCCRIWSTCSAFRAR